MNIKLIGCLSTKKEIEYLCSSLPIEYEFLAFDLHGVPKKLHAALQKKIDECQQYDLIILTYSRCSNMIIGLVSHSTPLLLPVTHDCIALLLGSDERRAALVRKNPGAYYFSPGWLDYGRTPYEEYQEYVAQFGEIKAKYLIETLYGQYNEAVFINTCSWLDLNKYREQVQEIAKFFGWKVSEVNGDLTLLGDIVNGNATSASIIVPPGKVITAEDIPGG
jgi:hypothetical protein